MAAEHHPLASRYTVLSAHCLISVLCVTNVYNIIRQKTIDFQCKTSHDCSPNVWLNQHAVYELMRIYRPIFFLLAHKDNTFTRYLNVKLCGMTDV